MLPGKYTLKLVGLGEDGAATGDLDLNGDVIIQSANAKVTVIKGKKDRVFHVLPGVTATIRQLAIAKGSLLTKDPNASSDDFEGGGILNQGTLSLDNVVVTGSTSLGNGGGISNQSVLTMSQVAITKNKSLDRGGGLYNSAAGTVTASAVTIAKNQASDEGGGVSNSQTSTVTMSNTILDRNAPFNCAGPVTPAGGNLETGATCGLGPNDSNIKKMGLASLKINALGIFYPTHLLKAGSPAIDNGNDTECPDLDQNFRSRIDVANVGASVCDSGATEFQGP